MDYDKTGEIEAYKAFSQIYDVQFEAPYPPVRDSSYATIIGLGIVTLASVLLSATRTAGAFYTAAAIEGENIAKVVVPLAIFAFEGGLVIIAAMDTINNHKEPKWALDIATVIALATSIVAGIVLSLSSVVAAAPYMGSLNIILNIVIGLGAPVLAYTYGHAFGFHFVTSQTQYDGLMMEYNEKLAAWKEQKQTHWLSSSERRISRSQLSRTVRSLANEQNEQPVRSYAAENRTMAPVVRSAIPNTERTVKGAQIYAKIDETGGTITARQLSQAGYGSAGYCQDILNQWRKDHPNES